MNCILVDLPEDHAAFRPLTLNRPISDLRLGILTLAQKYETYLGATVTSLTEEYLQEIYAPMYAQENLYVNACLLLDSTIQKELLDLPLEFTLLYDGHWLATKSSKVLSWKELILASKVESKTRPEILRHLPDLFLKNGEELTKDYKLLTKGRTSQNIIDAHTKTYGIENIFLEDNVHMRAVTFNAENGPIYIEEGAILQENSLVIGPAYIGRDSMVAFGSKIRNNTSIGPVSRVGGEVGNCIVHSHSNKAHDGFLGNSYIGAWCNLGANTNNSNLKNNYKPVSLYSYKKEKQVDTGEIFCGSFIGDYTKLGISTMLNTGTVIGISSNVFGAGFQEKFIPSFTWGGKAEGYSQYHFDKAIETIQATKARRGLMLEEKEKKILEKVFAQKKDHAV